METKNLMEILATDQNVLLGNFLGNIGMKDSFKEFQKQHPGFSTVKIMGKNRVAGKFLLETHKNNPRKNIPKHLSLHGSDIVRGWGAFLWMFEENLPLSKRFEIIKSYAADPHWGVRELAFMSIRPFIADSFNTSKPHLTKWVKSKDANLRRCAIEATRPRGVWCKHFDLMKDKPEEGLFLLDVVKSDDSLYVRKSVANWLNDASKSKPVWVKKICAQWKKESETKETTWIIKRGLRTLSAKR